MSDTLEEAQAVPHKTGAWTQWNVMDKQSTLIFNLAMKNYETDICYIPLKYKSQVVAGLNYQYLCDVKPEPPKGEPNQAIVYIFCPLGADSKPYVTKVTPQ